MYIGKKAILLFLLFDVLFGVLEFGAYVWLRYAPVQVTFVCDQTGKHQFSLIYKQSEWYMLVDDKKMKPEESCTVSSVTKF